MKYYEKFLAIRGFIGEKYELTVQGGGRAKDRGEGVQAVTAELAASACQWRSTGLIGRKCGELARGGDRWPWPRQK